MQPRKHTRQIIFHHSLSDTGNVEEIRKWHLARNFSDIGYHYVVLKDGTIEQGRRLNLIGAHAAGRNSDSIGVCLIGNFHKYEPTTAQIASCLRIMHDLSHMITPGWEHPLKVSFHRPHIFNLLKPLEYRFNNSCPGSCLDRADFLEIVSRHK